MLIVVLAGLYGWLAACLLELLVAEVGVIPLDGTTGRRRKKAKGIEPEALTRSRWIKPCDSRNAMAFAH